jgi:hypothetical protein
MTKKHEPGAPPQRFSRRRLFGLGLGLGLAAALGAGPPPARAYTWPALITDRELEAAKDQARLLFRHPLSNEAEFEAAIAHLAEVLRDFVNALRFREARSRGKHED